MLLTFPVAFWSWGICSPSKQFSMYCGSTVLREVQLKVIEIEISGPSEENHYQSSSQGSRLNKHLAERQVQCFWSTSIWKAQSLGLGWDNFVTGLSRAGYAGRHHRTAMCRTPPQQPALTEGAKFPQKIHISVALHQQRMLLVVHTKLAGLSL